MSAELLATLEPLQVQKDTHEMHKKIKEMISQAQSLIVDNEGAYKEVTRIYREAQTAKKAIDGRRKELVTPFRDEISRINDRAKSVLDPLDRITEIANMKASSYQRLLEDRRQKEEEKLRAAAALFDAEEEIYVAPLEKVTRGDGANLVTKVEKRFRLVDITKVPAKYLLIDESAVRKDLQLGVNEIPGLDVYDETTTTLRVR